MNLLFKHLEDSHTLLIVLFALLNGGTSTGKSDTGEIQTYSQYVFTFILHSKTLISNKLLMNLIN